MTIYYLVMGVYWDNGSMHVDVHAGLLDGSDTENFDLVFASAAAAATDLKTDLIAAASTRFNGAVTVAINAADF